MINKELLNILACPKCRGGIRLSKDGQSIVCDRCRLVYEVSEDIPVMLIDSAKQLEVTKDV